MNIRSLPLVRTAEKEVAPWIEVFARVGFAAKGVLYMTIGGLAAAAALGMGGNANPDSRHALDELFEAPFGRFLVGIIAVGLVGYGLWRVIEGIADPQNRGASAKGIAHRAASIARGVIHLGLAFAAGTLAIEAQRSNNDGGRIEAWAGKALGVPGGVYILWTIAAAIFAYGIYQLYKAWRAKLSRELQLGRLGARTRRWTIGVSRFGIAARGVVFGTIGVLFARAARDHDPTQAGGVGESLGRLFVELGRGPYLAIAIGLVAYGIYEVINAKYRRIQI